MTNLDNAGQLKKHKSGTCDKDGIKERSPLLNQTELQRLNDEIRQVNTEVDKVNKELNSRYGPGISIASQFWVVSLVKSRTGPLPPDEKRKLLDRRRDLNAKLRELETMILRDKVFRLLERQNTGSLQFVYELTKEDLEEISSAESDSQRLGPLVFGKKAQAKSKLQDKRNGRQQVLAYLKQQLDKVRAQEGSEDREIMLTEEVREVELELANLDDQLSD
ncbi:MAG: hypothetical protein HY671_02890 [Chloroflexi bacterium]|nr:hypothetical protein [Chloroflexota bacterium]